jgi:alkylation response protein AidB-like acyl-CoA dehydrogenase
MTQISQGWGSGPSAGYEGLAARFRPIFQRIRETAISRELARELPHQEVAWLREAGFTALRAPGALGGSGVSLPEFFALLIELSEADPNVTNVLRAHFGFIEDVLNSQDAEWRDLWLQRVVEGQIVGNGYSEIGDAKVSTFQTKLLKKGDRFELNGTKYYTTGSLFADWISLVATNENDEFFSAVVSRTDPGVNVIDDWDGFGQSLTASGTTHFTNVLVDEAQVRAFSGLFGYATAFYQLVHLATLAGIGRSAANDVARLVRERTRIYSHGNASRAAEDPQILQIVGRVRSAAYGAGAIVLKTAEALQRAYEAHLLDDSEKAEAADKIAELETGQAVTVVTNEILDATTLLFDALGASAAKRGHGLDRHWRNARTISSHNPRIYHHRIVGNFAVNGASPPGIFRVGTP